VHELIELAALDQLAFQPSARDVFTVALACVPTDQTVNECHVDRYPRSIASERDEPTQETQPKKGAPVEIPVPKRSMWDRMLKKAARPTDTDED
jgi:hypothetical protein